ncbi:hypothetical protein BGZ54_004369 [Gamsiella multidivaricata]|nr:hypothetical protein BGZ54_004369 [Gamsiella multidivaricata]
MHRAARSLTINTSNACLVNKFNNSANSSSSSVGGRPYTPPPPSCRLHKIYEEKLEVLGSLGYENWFDDHANPFYRHAEPELSRRGIVHHPNPFDLVDIVIESAPSNNTCMKPFQSFPQGSSTTPTTKHVADKAAFSAEFTGFESLDSDSDPDDALDFFGDAGEIRGLFFTGYRDSRTLDDDEQDAAAVRNLPKPKSELEHRRLSNRNRIMDRGHLMPDTTVFVPLPLPREPRFVLGTKPVGGPKVRALSPYPKSRCMRQD